MRYARLAWLVVLSQTVGCGGSSGAPAGPSQPPPGGPTVAKVTIVPHGLTIPVGGQGQLVAVATDASGNPMTSATIAWASANAAIASVSSSGAVSGVSAGQAQVIASAATKADTVLVIVTSSFSLVVTPGAATADIGKSAQFLVQAVDANGVPFPSTPPVTWRSSAPTIATISNAGLATGIAAGATSITAAAGLVVSNAAVLTVRDTATAGCGGIASMAGFTGSLDYGYTAVRLPTSGGFLVDADDNGALTATLTRTQSGPLVAVWSGPVGGGAGTNQKRTSGTDIDTRTSTGGIVPIPGVGLPQMVLTVDLQTCRFRLVAGASVLVRQVIAGIVTQGPELVGSAQFSGDVPLAWRTLGIVRFTDQVHAHSVVWAATHPNDDAVVPLGFPVSLFDPIDAVVGQGVGGFLLTPKP